MGFNSGFKGLKHITDNEIHCPSKKPVSYVTGKSP